MEIRRLDRAGLEHAYGVDGQRLLPWPALNAPFEGAWCVIRAGTASVPHAHDEYEIFIAISGQAVVEADGERTPLLAGDVVHMRPGMEHRVVNDGDRDFEMYSVWWDEAMTERFAARHRDGG
ncbi:MAG: cupin domain-containing protein [Solirubrobacteraceae bacterium]